LDALWSAQADIERSYSTGLNQALVVVPQKLVSKIKISSERVNVKRVGILNLNEFIAGVKKRNRTEQNGINGIFSETERNETENI
jgi:hypothetical protein